MALLLMWCCLKQERIPQRQTGDRAVHLLSSPSALHCKHGNITQTSNCYVQSAATYTYTNIHMKF